MENIISKISYTINMMVKEIKKGGPIDIDKRLGDLQIVYDYFEQIECFGVVKHINSLMKVVAKLDPNMEEMLRYLLKVKKQIDEIKEKTKMMEIKKAEALIKYHDSLSRKRRRGCKAEKIAKYDIIFTPTQGGGHLSVVYEIYENGMALCFPFTTASEFDLRKLGNKSWTLMDCDIKGFNGNRLSSSATLVNIKDAGFFKRDHLAQHQEIDLAVSYFQSEDIAG